MLTIGSNCATSHPKVNKLLSEKKERNPINILSREEQDFSHQDASGQQRLSWNLPPVSTTTKAFAVSRYP